MINLNSRLPKKNELFKNLKKKKKVKSDTSNTVYSAGRFKFVDDLH